MSKLSHINEAGDMHMVDVGDKPATRRVAIAEARVVLGEDAREQLRTGSAAKGDVLAAARLAGIGAAKRTGDLIPLCHPLPLSHASVDVQLEDWGARIVTRAETTGPTGVEMEALTAASVAALTLYDDARFGAMLGGYFRTTVGQDRVVVLDVEDQAHPATRMLGSTWPVADEFYEFGTAAWSPDRPEENVDALFGHQARGLVRVAEVAHTHVHSS